MRILLIIILGIFLTTYAWEWLIRVPTGAMDTATYTEYYFREVNENFQFFLGEIRKAIDLVKKPLPQVKLAQM